jgi:hypothetical protein
MTGDWNTYTVAGKEGDMIIVRQRGSLTIRDIDPAIQRQMPHLTKKTPTSTRIINLIQSLTTLKD